MKYLYSFFILIIQSLSVFSQTEGLKIITIEELLKTDRFMASKELQGRLAGSEGYNKAADFMSNEFSKLKLKPLGDKGYFQNFNVEYNEIYSAELKLLKNDKSEKTYELGKDYVCRTLTGKGNIKAGVVFCGYGLSKPEQNYDDYASADVKGKIVIVFKQNPTWKINNKEWDAIYSRDKAHIAAEHGAIGLILVSKPNDKEPQKPIGSAMDGDKEELLNFPIIHIDLSIVKDFLEGTNFNIKNLQSRIDSLKKPFSVNLNNQASIRVESKYTKNGNTKNIIGMLEGADPRLKDEYILITAHLDHVGEQAGKIFFPGANDNGSGSSAVLQLARAFSSERSRLKRSVIFVLYACEEHGLDGSKFLAEHFPYSLEKLTAQINLDCIGHGDSIQVRCGYSYPKLWKLAKIQDSLFTKRSSKETTEGGGADLQPMFEKGVPGIYLATTNSYTHLHLTTDTPETLNPELFEKTCKLAYLTAYQIAIGNYTRENKQIIKH